MKHRVSGCGYEVVDPARDARKIQAFNRSHRCFARQSFAESVLVPGCSMRPGKAALLPYSSSLLQLFSCTQRATAARTALWTGFH